jgi:hypothetical protein
LFYFKALQNRLEKNDRWESCKMYVGSKGWFVHELKKLGIRYHNGRKLEVYKAYVLANLLEKMKK